MAQTVYNVWASNNTPRNFEEITIGASETLVPGTAIGKITHAAGTAAAGGSNTGDGAVSAFDLAAGGPAKIGTYQAICVEAVTNSGLFNVIDPDGIMIGQMTITVSGDTTFTGGGITFNIADGATDFVLGDLFDFPVEAGSGNGVTLDIALTNGANKWRGVMVEPIATEEAGSAVTVIATSGDFHSQGMVFAGSTVLSDVKDEAQLKNCYIHTSHSDENIEVG